MSSFSEELFHISLIFWLLKINTKNEFLIVFALLSFSVFSCFLVLFGRPPALFWHPFGASGVPLAFSWVPLARLGCLWGLSSTFSCHGAARGGL